MLIVLGLIPEFASKYPELRTLMKVGKRNLPNKNAPNLLNGTSERKKRMTEPSPLGVIRCPIYSILGLKRQERPFTCQMRQMPLLAMIGVLSAFLSCLLGCCCCKCFRRMCCKGNAYKPDTAREGVSSSNRDVVMIRA